MSEITTTLLTDVFSSLESSLQHLYIAIALKLDVKTSYTFIRGVLGEFMQNFPNYFAYSKYKDRHLEVIKIMHNSLQNHVALDSEENLTEMFEQRDKQVEYSIDKESSILLRSLATHMSSIEDTAKRDSQHEFLYTIAVRYLRFAMSFISELTYRAKIAKVDDLIAIMYETKLFTDG